jgi:hypothetical protein
VTELLTPGLHRRPLDPIPAERRLARGDVAALLGYAVRGPVGAPVRIAALSQFEDVFGPPPAHGHLWHAVKGFFESGGRSAYVLRVAPGTARAATVELGSWRATASFPWTMVDPRRLTGAPDLGSAPWTAVVERQVLAHGPRSPEPGSVGNRLAVVVRRTSRVRSATVPEVLDGGTASRLVSLAGLERWSVLELSQAGAGAVIRLPADLDPVRRSVRWPGPLTGFDLRRSIRVASVEFDVEIHSDGRAVQSFPALAPHPGHTYSLAGVLESGCRFVEMHPLGDPDPDWTDPVTWPAEGLFGLRGGTDGLEDTTKRTWLDVLDRVAGLTEAALVAAPDLVLADTVAPPVSSTPPAVVDCADLRPPPQGHLRGTVTEFDPHGVERPLGGVTVDVTGPGGLTVTAADGSFTLSDIDEGLVTLRLTRQGYEPVEFPAQSSPFRSAPAVPIVMTRIVTPPALDAEDVLEVQRALADPVRVGPYKIAVVDPPAPHSRLDELLTWSARLGDGGVDGARLGFFAPWLLLPGTGTGDPLACPPSGHVCGAFAAAENAIGVHRSGANLPLRYVDATTLAVDDADQAQLNPAGVNAIRAFPGRGIRVFGTRSLAADPQWRFLTVRRIVDAIEKTLEQAVAWMVFEPNNVITRRAVATTAAALLTRLHRDGVLAGAAPEAAFAVRCDLENNPDDSRDAGLLVLDVAVAPTEPYEFVVFRIGHAHDALQVTENPR